MKALLSSLALLSVLALAGCSTTSTTSTAWQYKTWQVGAGDEVERPLNQFVAEGWRIEEATFAYDHGWASSFVLKRKQPAQRPVAVEYKILSGGSGQGDLSQQLNLLLGEGWSLVKKTTAYQGGWATHYFLKRKKA